VSEIKHTTNPDRRASVRPRRTHIFTPEPGAHYVEPLWCDTRLFEKYFGAPGALILDPACGWGRIPQAAKAAGYTVIASDIVDRRRELDGVEFQLCNFLTCSPVRSVRSIVVNPPFMHIKEFAERALEIATYKVALLVPLRRLPAARWLERLPLETVYLLTPRPSLPPGAWIDAGNIPGGGSQDFAWLVINRTLTTGAPRLRWLHRDGGARDA
jgi:hypothetical protein